MKTIDLMKKNPFYKSLRTHKVLTKNFGTKYSSRVTNDIRIIWGFSEEKNLVIYLMDLGGHNGTNKVYSKSS